MPPHSKVQPLNTEEKFESEVSLLESQALNFSSRFIQDSKVRSRYVELVEKTSIELLTNVKTNRISLETATKQAVDMRNILVRSSRLQLTELGLSFSKSLKRELPTLHDLFKVRSTQMYSKPFEQLDGYQRNQVLLEIIKSGSRGDATVSKIANVAGKMSRVLIVVTIAVGIYEVCAAQDKIAEIKKQTLAISGSVIGASIIGPLGALCGPGAIVCVPLFIAVGGFLGAYGGEYLSEWK